MSEQFGNVPPPLPPPPPSSPGAHSGYAAPPPPGAGSWAARLRPLNTGDVLDGMFRLFLRHWKHYIAAVAAITVPVQLISAYAQRELVSDVGLLEVFSDPVAAQAAAASSPGIGEFAGAAGTPLVMVLLVSPLLTGIVCVLAARAHLGEPVRAGDALRIGLRRYLPLVVSNMLMLLLLGVVVGLLFVPMLLAAAVGAAFESVFVIVLGLSLLLLALPVAIAIYTLFFVAPAAVVLEECGPVAALRRSFALVRRRFWGVLGIGLLAFVISMVISTVLGWPFTIPALLFGGTVGLMMTALGGIVSSLLTTPLLPNALVLLYFDTRVRGEGLDLEAMAAAVEQPGEAKGPA